MFSLPPLSLPLVLGLILGAALLLTLIMSAILLYHWWRYGMDAPAVFLAGALYFGGLIFFVAQSLTLLGTLR